MKKLIVTPKKKPTLIVKQKPLQRRVSARKIA